MCWEFKSRLSDGRNEKAEEDRAGEMRARRAEVIATLAGGGERNAPQAASDHTPTKESVPAE